MTDRNPYHTECLVCGGRFASVGVGDSHAHDWVLCVAQNMPRLRDKIRDIEKRLSDYESGQYVPIPVSPAHATAMMLIAERYLGEHPDD